MIFKGDKELTDLIDFRKRALERKREFYRANNLPFSGINQVESIIREVMERVYEIHPDYPCVEVREDGNLGKSRNKVDLHPYARSQKWENGYRIIFHSDMTIYLGRRIGEIFADAEFLRKRNNMKGYEPKLKIYDKPIYNFAAYERYQVCKTELIDFLVEISIWYISLHEYAHIINGHCDLKNDYEADGISLDIEQWRALEIHADLMAAELLFDVLKSWKKYVGVLQIVPQPNGKNPGLSFFEEIVFATVGVYICMRSFVEEEKWDEWSVRMHEMNQKKHPLAELRMAIVSNFFLNKLLDLAESEVEKSSIMNQYFLMITQFEEFYFENIPDRAEDENPVFYNPTQLIRTEDGKKYFKTIFDTLMSINDLLGKYMVVPTAIEGIWRDYEIIPDVSSPLDL